MKSETCTTRLALGNRLNLAASFVRRKGWSILSLIVIPLFASLLSAQTTGLGTISGRVLDPTGAAIPGAHLTLTNTATGVAASVTSNDGGLYRAGDLIPGPYKIAVISNGYQELQQEGITLVSDASETVDIKLTIGQSTQH